MEEKETDAGNLLDAAQVAAEAVAAVALVPQSPVTLATVPPPQKGAAALTAVGERGVMLRNLEELIRFARMAVGSGLAPKGMNEQAAALCIQAGMERGLGPLGGLQALVAINGNLSWRGQAALGLLRSSGAVVPGSLRAWVEGEGEERKGICVSLRAGYRDVLRSEFSVADAKRAGLWGKAGPWSQYPDRQLQWRAVGFHARDHYSDVLGGFALAEEAEDFEERRGIEGRGVTPATRAASLPPAAADPLRMALTPPEEDPEEEGGRE